MTSYATGENAVYSSFEGGLATNGRPVRWLSWPFSETMPESNETGEASATGSTQSSKFWIRSPEHFSLQTAHTSHEAAVTKRPLSHN